MECHRCEHKPCCQGSMPVEISLDFIFRLADHLNISPMDAFERHCTARPFLVSPPHDYVLGIILRDPCPFFDNGCRIHKIKPISCLTFPATVLKAGYSGAYQDYPCLNGSLKSPGGKESGFAEAFREKLRESCFYLLNEKILYSSDQPYLNLIDLAEQDDEVKEFLDIAKKRHPDAKEKKAMQEIIQKNLKKTLHDSEIAEHISEMTGRERKAVLKINRIYFRLRRKHLR